MIDPITAFATAKAAFAGVQRLVNGGQEIQDVLGQLARWAQAAEDLKAWCGMESKPSIFKKLTFQNDTAHALQVLQYRTAIANQEKELREFLIYQGAANAWEDFVQIRRDIKRKREATVYEQMRRRKAFMEMALACGMIVAGSLMIGFMVNLIVSYA
jgi:hypothetical protein